jgi:D-glycero-D-manno-heptose 1,7-bisphosphate phosphatase
MLEYNNKNSAVPTPGKQSGRALLLDRDGVINEDINYLHRKEDFKFIPGIFDLCRTAAEHNFMLIIITNQSGIARGYYSENDFMKLTEWMFSKFAERGIKLTKLYACPHLATADLPEYRLDCPARKPNPGMLLKAQAEFNLDLPECVLIGDKVSDMEAGIRAGIGRLFLLDNNQYPAALPYSEITKVSSLEEARKKLFIPEL